MKRGLSLYEFFVVLIFIGQAADVWTTLLGVMNYGIAYELNPIVTMANLPWLMLLKLAIPLIVVYIDIQFIKGEVPAKRRKWINVAVIAFAMWFSWSAPLHNLGFIEGVNVLMCPICFVGI